MTNSRKTWPIGMVNFIRNQLVKAAGISMLGAPDSTEGIVLLAPERPVPNGSRIA
ncbi:MAG: hypothetical protein ACK5XQ_12430 [Flavobacteriales bacterium]